MVEKLHLALLGNPEVSRDGVPLAGLRPGKALALLCYLAVTGRPHLRPSLIGLLWGDMPEALARNNLSKALTHLRPLVGPYLHITHRQVAFNAADNILREQHVSGAGAVWSGPSDTRRG